MATSIQVSRELHSKLKALKERMKAKTFEELLRRLVERPNRGVLGRVKGSDFLHPRAGAIFGFLRNSSCLAAVLDTRA